MTSIVFELFANLERLAGCRECTVDVDDTVATVGDAVARLAVAQPALAASLDRCACVSGDSIVRRADALPADRRIALLPPVAGG